MSERELLRHAFEHWDSCVIPDFTWLLHVDTCDEEALLNRPWWWLRHHVLALFRIPDSLTGAMFRQLQPKD